MYMNAFAKIDCLEEAILYQILVYKSKTKQITFDIQEDHLFGFSNSKFQELNQNLSLPN